MLFRSHLIGLQHFMGYDFKVNANALIPRKETEILGYAALKKIQACASKQEVVRVIDVCTGMGNLALAFRAHETKSRIIAADIEDSAILLAKENAVHLSLEEGVKFYTGDLFTPFHQQNHLLHAIDIITCNPPYISINKLQRMPGEIIEYEPKAAFNGGPFGLTLIFRLIKESLPFLKNGGWLCFEVGVGQGEGIKKMMERNTHFNKIECAMDEDNNIRALLAQVQN